MFYWILVLECLTPSIHFRSSHQLFLWIDSLSHAPFHLLVYPLPNGVSLFLCLLYLNHWHLQNLGGEVLLKFWKVPHISQGGGHPLCTRFVLVSMVDDGCLDLWAPGVACLLPMATSHTVLTKAYPLPQPSPTSTRFPCNGVSTGGRIIILQLCLFVNNGHCKPIALHSCQQWLLQVALTLCQRCIPQMTLSLYQQ